MGFIIKSYISKEKTTLQKTIPMFNGIIISDGSLEEILKIFKTL
jgi:hypothetical protein